MDPNNSVLKRLWCSYNLFKLCNSYYFSHFSGLLKLLKPLSYKWKCNKGNKTANEHRITSTFCSNTGKQRTSGPVNAHLTPGPGIYFNNFIHVYSPRAGADNPLGTNVDVNRKPLSLCPFDASFKTISLKYDFKSHFKKFYTCL